MDLGNDFLNVIAGFWVRQGLGGALTLDTGTGELEAQPTRNVPVPRYKLSNDDVLALQHIGLSRWLVARDPEQPRLQLLMTGPGIEEMLRRGDPNNSFVRLVSLTKQPREQIWPHLRNRDKVVEEVDRIEKDLHREVVQNNPNDTWHRIAASLHLLMVSPADQHLVRTEIDRRNREGLHHATLAELYFGDASIFGAYDALPEDPNDFWSLKWAREVWHDLPTPDFQTMICTLNQLPRAFDPITDTLLTREEWLAQNMLYGGGYDKDPKEAMYNIKTLLEVVRNTISAHSLPYAQNRQRLERLQSFVTVGDGHRHVSHLIEAMGRYICTLLTVFRLAREIGK